MSGDTGNIMLHGIRAAGTRERRALSRSNAVSGQRQLASQAAQNAAHQCAAELRADGTNHRLDRRFADRLPAAVAAAETGDRPAGTAVAFRRGLRLLLLWLGLRLPLCLGGIGSLLAL